jgi:hypothetical protein
MRSLSFSMGSANEVVAAIDDISSADHSADMLYTFVPTSLCDIRDDRCAELRRLLGHYRSAFGNCQFSPHGADNTTVGP